METGPNEHSLCLVKLLLCKQHTWLTIDKSQVRFHVLVETDGQFHFTCSPVHSAVNRYRMSVRGCHTLPSINWPCPHWQVSFVCSNLVKFQSLSAQPYYHFFCLFEPTTYLPSTPLYRLLPPLSLRTVQVFIIYLQQLLRSARRAGSLRQFKINTQNFKVFARMAICKWKSYIFFR